VTIEYGDFERVDVRVGTIVEVEDFPRARNPSYRLANDFGGEDDDGQIVLLTPTREARPGARMH
jgi:tRNA-binding EMAP/Myf-like protein